MTYHSYNIGTLGMLGDEYADQMTCLNKANASSQVRAIDAIIGNLSKNWNPTGYYRPADVQQILDMFATEAANAGAALAAAPLSTGDAADVKAQAFEDMLRKYKDRSQGYVRAIADARSAGASVINAPAFKSFVIAAMQSISDAYVTATVLQCRQSWAEKWLDKAYNAMAGIGAVAYKIIGVAAKVGAGVVNAIDTAGSIAATVIKYAPYAALGLGAYLLYGFIKNRQ